MQTMQCLVADTYFLTWIIYFNGSPALYAGQSIRRVNET